MHKHKISNSVLPLGDHAFLLRWNEPVTSAATLAAIAQAIGQLGLAWLQEIVPAYRTIAFYIRHLTISPEQAAEELLYALDLIEVQQLPPPRQIELPVVYGGKQGPDLADCARRSGISIEQFVERHSKEAYIVAMLGFAPGFPYLSGLDEALAQPRHGSPRLKVLAGSVGIAGKQTGVYSVTSPGGWQIIGRTARALFEPTETAPFLLSPGDIVRFVPVEAHEDAQPNKQATIKDFPTTPVITVLKPGLLTTVQDRGRRGWQAFGVSVGGAMDDVAMRAANLLIGNNEDEAVLEMTLSGGSYLFERNSLISLCGADLGASVNGERIPMNRPVFVSKGATLFFKGAISGCRSYLAIAGGIDVPYLLGSRSTDSRAQMGGGFGRGLQEGDTLGSLYPSKRAFKLQTLLQEKAEASDACWSSTGWSVNTIGWHEGDTYIKSPSLRARTITLRVLLGAEWEDFSLESQQVLFRKPFRVEPSSDRMGVRIAGEALQRKNHEELESHGVVPGTIQVPPSGQPIILGVACQPTGGYPKMAHVISVDLRLLAQTLPGDWIKFELTDSQTAEQELRKRERELAVMKAGLLAQQHI
ncbi:5-oxoprolinase subunit PxpB [Cohnella abietis]|uniref:Allophanate hydrolase n=1 Tax=Cohnella abietis TaxID=2507935 RepID=A0A3T1D2B4_9BACL|nr:5-oxoprolinase subunit PxpB [Cohnella abietis]BBI32169.1 hypothetical protein KCTCHS21_15680 [Cohnella abietis]